MKRQGVLSDVVRVVGASMVFSCLLAVPAWAVAGSKGLVGVGASAVLCVVPACIVLLLKGVAGESQPLLVLVAGGVRMFFVFAGVFAARQIAPEYGVKEFFGWLVLFYMFVLAVESFFALSRLKQ